MLRNLPIKTLLGILLFAFSANAQGIGGAAGIGGKAGFGGGATASSTVTYDTSVFDNTTDCGPGGVATKSITVGTGHTNTALIIFVGINDTGSVHVSTVASSAGSVSFTKFGSTVTGGNEHGEVWEGIGTIATGAQTITVTLNTFPSAGCGFAAYSLYGVNQTTPINGSVTGTTSGSQAISISANDMAVSVQFDTSNNRTVTGCTSSTDFSNYSNSGASGAHCSSSPTSTFTWSGFGTNSVAVGIDVGHS